MIRKLTMSALVVAALAMNVPAFAQAQGDQFSSAGNEGQFASDVQGNTGTQTRQEQDSQAPTLQGATNGTIGPQGSDATYITGVNTAGTVRVNNLANSGSLAQHHRKRYGNPRHCMGRTYHDHGLHAHGSRHTRRNEESTLRSSWCDRRIGNTRLHQLARCFRKRRQLVQLTQSTPTQTVQGGAQAPLSLGVMRISITSI